MSNSIMQFDRYETVYTYKDQEYFGSFEDVLLEILGIQKDHYLIVACPKCRSEERITDEEYLTTHTLCEMCEPED